MINIKKVRDYKNFSKAFKKLMEVEGKYYDGKDNRDKNETNFGITRIFLENTNVKKELKDLTIIDAFIIYKKYIWDKCKINLLSNYYIQTNLFESIVNLGPYNAIKIIQKTHNDISKDKIIIDGLIGKNTLAALNKIGNVEYFIFNYSKNKLDYYIEISKNNKDLLCNLKGWKNRIFKYLQEVII